VVFVDLWFCLLGIMSWETTPEETHG
jgi:hypothetical protein